MSEGQNGVARYAITPKKGQRYNSAAVPNYVIGCIRFVFTFLSHADNTWESGK